MMQEKLVTDCPKCKEIIEIKISEDDFFYLKHGLIKEEWGWAFVLIFFYAFVFLVIFYFLYFLFPISVAGAWLYINQGWAALHGCFP